MTLHKGTCSVAQSLPSMMSGWRSSQMYKFPRYYMHLSCSYNHTNPFLHTLGVWTKLWCLLTANSLHCWHKCFAYNKYKVFLNKIHKWGHNHEVSSVNNIFTDFVWLLCRSQACATYRWITLAGTTRTSILWHLWHFLFNSTYCRR